MVFIYDTLIVLFSPSLFHFLLLSSSIFSHSGAATTVWARTRCTTVRWQALPATKTTTITTIITLTCMGVMDGLSGRYIILKRAMKKKLNCSRWSMSVFLSYHILSSDHSTSYCIYMFFYYHFLCDSGGMKSCYPIQWTRFFYPKLHHPHLLYTLCYATLHYSAPHCNALYCTISLSTGMHCIWSY